MARNLAAGLRVNLYLASSIDEVKKMMATNKVTHVFMGYREYRDNKSYIRLLSREKVTIAVLKDKDSPDIHEENILTVDKPVYGLQVAQIHPGEMGFPLLIDIHGCLDTVFADRGIQASNDKMVARDLATTKTAYSV